MVGSIPRVLPRYEPGPSRTRASSHSSMSANISIEIARPPPFAMRSISAPSSVKSGYANTTL